MSCPCPSYRDWRSPTLAEPQARTQMDVPSLRAHPLLVPPWLCPLLCESQPLACGHMTRPLVFFSPPRVAALWATLGVQGCIHSGTELRDMNPRKKSHTGLRNIVIPFGKGILGFWASKCGLEGGGNEHMAFCLCGLLHPGPDLGQGDSGSCRPGPRTVQT